MNVIRTSVRASLRRNRLALALLSVATAPAIAQPAADAADVSTLDTVVVTASGFEQKITDAPASISVISAEELRQRPYITLIDAVRDLEGVDVGETSDKTEQKTISIRGMRAGLHADPDRRQAPEQPRRHLPQLVRRQPVQSYSAAGHDPAHRSDPRAGVHPVRRRRAGRGDQHHHAQGVGPLAGLGHARPRHPGEPRFRQRQHLRLHVDGAAGEGSVWAWACAVRGTSGTRRRPNTRRSPRRTVRCSSGRWALVAAARPWTTPTRARASR